MHIVETRGNRELMNREKTLFICSKRTPVGLYDYMFRWTDSLSEKDCIACFNSTEMETEVLAALLVARIPTILFVMNRFTDTNNIQIEQALQENRLLIAILRCDKTEDKRITPRLRNKYVISLCQHIVCGYVNKNGSVFSLLAGKNNVTNLLSNEHVSLIAESSSKYERWTVAQDKVLLRMYYADMGIHAIHTKLQRTYPAIYSRIRAITVPEEVLKGREFEDHILRLFNLNQETGFTLKEWQGAKTLEDICPENNRHPDFVFDYLGQKFAVECKWRERLSSKMGQDLFPADKLSIYQQFSAERSIPVFIALGLGGKPSAPKRLYIIPLPQIPSILSSTKLIEEFLRPSADAPFHLTDFITEDYSLHKK